MDFLELAEKRYSVRKFTGVPVRDEDMERILRAGQLAPTACNKQPQRILVINSPEGREKLYRCTVSHFNAPTALIVCYDKRDCWVRDYDGKPSGEIDASIAATHMMLEAANIGVGVTWVMYFIPEAVRVEFELPEEFEPVAMLVMGYPAPDAKPYPGHTQSRPIGETVFHEKF